MPDGFSSVADMRVIVDANAEKFHSGVNGILGALDALGVRGGDSLGGFDKMLAAVGDAALGVRGKFNMMVSGIEAGIAIYQRLAAEGRAVAEVLGVTAEYDNLKASIDDLGMSLQDVAIAGFFAVQSASMSATGEVFAFAGATEAGNAASKDFATTLLERVTSAIDSVRLQLRLLLADNATSAGEIDKTLELLNRKIEEAERQGAQSASPQGWGSMLLRSITDFFGGPAWVLARSGYEWIQAAEGDVNRLYEQREELLKRRSEIPGQHWIDGTTTHISLLGQEIQRLEQRNATLGMSTAAAAEYNAVQNAIAEARRRNIPLTEEELAQIRREAAVVGDLTRVYDEFQQAQREAEREKQLAQARDRAETAVFANADREIANLRARAEAISLNAREAAAMTMQERILQQLRAQGREITEAEIVKARALGEQYGRLSEQLIANQDQLREMAQYGQLIGRGMDDMFTRWARGAEMTKDAVADMAVSILADLARIAWQKSVTEPLVESLFGGGSSGGGLLASLFGGGRAEGGNVDPGKFYLVGEKGPELFVPKGAGDIVPNSRLGGGVSVSVNTTIDARGAYPESIADIRRAVEESSAMVPQRAVEAVREATERGGL